MTKSDKEVFQSFASAQVSISNEIYCHLNRNQPNRPNFFFCPTQYCSTRAIPTVTESEYLNTIGQKLNPAIDIFWTGSKVISKILTAEDIREITEVLRRKPLIWDNLHANDYDQKRVFLGPYIGRSPELIPLLRGVVTNPNCEFHANTIAIHTLGQWSRCSTEVNSKLNRFSWILLKLTSSPSPPDSISDIKLETENDDDDENPPNYLTENIYRPRAALKNAILEWLPDFFQEKQAFGPIVKPHPTSALAPIIPPIIPSINTCMTLTLTTPTTSSSVSTMMIPEVNTAQLHALADICSSVTGATEMLTKPSVMNSLVSATKVVTTDVLSNPIPATTISIPEKMPVSSVPIPISVSETMEVEKTPSEAITDETMELMDCGTPKHTSDSSSLNSDVQLSSENQKDEVKANSPNHQMEPEVKNEKSQLSDDVVMETISNHSMQIETASDDEKTTDISTITYDDILLFCDLFYLPFEHGKQGLQLMNEFQWLKINATVLSGKKKTEEGESAELVQEWFRRSEKLLKLGDSIFLLTRRIASCVNRELCYDLFTYAWEISSVISIYMAYVKWLALGQFPANANSYTQGSYTWFSKGWKETFMSGDQEPWVSSPSFVK
jgi:protein O-GlcNAcase / histone acetyltransferase